MSDQDGVTIPIHIPLVGTGGEDAARQLKTAQTATESATAAAKQNTEALTAEASAQEKLNSALAARPATSADRAYGAQMSSDAAAALATPGDDPTTDRAAAEERLAGLISQRMAVEEAETELLQAQAAGQTGKVAELEAEIGLRTESLMLQRAGILSEEEAVAVATQRFAAREAIALQDRAQAAFNAQLIAQEEAKLTLERAQTEAQEAFNAQLIEEAAIQERNEAAAAKVYGRGGRAGQFAQNFGAGQSMGASIGLGVFAGAAVAQMIDEMIKKTEERAIEEAKVTDEMMKQVSAWSEMAQKAQNPGDVSRLAEHMSSSIDQLQQRIDGIRIMPDGVLERGKTDFGAFSAWLDEQRDKLTGNVPSDTLLGIREQEQKMYRTSGEVEQDELKQRMAQQETDANRIYDQAAAHAKRMQDIAAMPESAQRPELEDELEKATKKQEAAEKWSKSADRTDPHAGRMARQALSGAKDEVAEIQKRMEALDKATGHTADEARRLEEEFKQANEKGMSPEDKLAALNKRAEGMKGEAQEMAGDDIQSPADLMQAAAGMTGQAKIEAEQLAIAWQKVDAAAGQTNDKIDEQAAKTEKQAEADDKEWDEFIDKTQEAFDHLDQMKSEMATQNAILQALVDGDKSRAKELQDQLSSQKEIARLVKEGMAPEEAKAEAAKTQALRDQLDLKEKAAKVKSIDDDDKIKHDEATHNKPALARDQRQKYEDDQRKKLQEAGLSGDDLNKKLASEMHDYNLTHPHDIGGPTKHAENDDLGKQMSDKDWRDQFKPGADHKDPLANPHNPSGDSLNPNHSSAPMSRDNNIPDNLGVTPSHDFDSLKPLAPPAAPPPPPPPPPQAASDHGGGDGGAGAIQSAASALQSAGSSGSAAAGALQAAATALQAAATALQSKGGGGGSGLTGSAGDSSPVGNPPPDNGG